MKPNTEWAPVQDAVLRIVGPHARMREAVYQRLRSGSPEPSRFECRRRSGRWEVRERAPFIDVAAVLDDSRRVFLDTAAVMADRSSRRAVET